MLSKPRVRLQVDGCTYRYGIICLHANGISCLVGERVIKTPLVFPPMPDLIFFFFPPKINYHFQLTGLLTLNMQLFSR